MQTIITKVLKALMKRIDKYAGRRYEESGDSVFLKIADTQHKILWDAMVRINLNIAP